MIAAPYEEYIVTQGLHGQSYGHLAIDIAAGKGATILSPINGVVTQRYIDQWGNPTIVIENDYYQVTMLHGLYTADVGTPLRLGQPVGIESNVGYTMDMFGRLCTNRDCGYHTHLNIFDKRLGTNVDPLSLIPPSK
jgi:murein DD-endopeptidase MepM/ murein hydrolase activator NlpD